MRDGHILVLAGLCAIMAGALAVLGQRPGFGLLAMFGGAGVAVIGAIMLAGLPT